MSIEIPLEEYKKYEGGLQKISKFLLRMEKMLYILDGKLMVYSKKKIQKNYEDKFLLDIFLYLKLKIKQN